jgi:hypothetical protein
VRVAIVVAALTRIAHADGSDAEKAFQRGHELLKAGKIDEACTAFGESLKLDFQYGTLYNLAGCDEKRGKLLAAWQEYERLAAEDTNAPRRAHSKELASQLEPRVPKLVVDIAAPRPAGIAVAIDGTPIAELGAPQPVELGSHEIVATAPGFQRWRTTITAGERATVKVQPALEPLPAGAPVKPLPPVETPEPAMDRRMVRDYPVVGPTLTIAGGASLAFGVGLALHARSLFESSKAGAMRGEPAALEDNRNAVRDGNIATGFVVAGIVVAPIGALLWHRGTWIVTPRADARGGAVSISGRF